MYKAITALSFALAVFVCDSASAEQRWGDFKKDQCTALGVRQYSAVLWDIPWGKSWEEACKNMPATIEGQSFASPLRCRNTGQMWGEFEASDPSCAPRWGDWHKETCVAFSAADKPASFGFRRYAAILWDIPAGTDWLATCQKAAVTLTVDAKPYSFPSPHICATADSKGITAAVATGLTVGATGLALPTGPIATLAVVPLSALLAQAAQNVGKTPLNVWGNVFIPDGSCNASNSTTIAASDTTGLVTKTPTSVPSKPVEATEAQREQECFDAVQNKVAWDTAGHTSWSPQNIKDLCAGSNFPTETVDCFTRLMPAKGWKKAIESCSDTKVFVIGGEQAHATMPVPPTEVAVVVATPTPSKDVVPAPPAGGEKPVPTSGIQPAEPSKNALLGPVKLPVSARDLDVKNGVVWIVGSDHAISQLVDGSWQRIDGTAVRIAVDPSGNPWIVNSAGKILRRSNGAWKEVPGLRDGLAQDIAITKSGEVWMVADRGTVTRLTDSGWTAAESINVAKQIIALPHIDTLQLVDQNGKRWTRESATSWVIRADASGLADRYVEFAIDLDGTKWGIDSSYALWKIGK